MSSSIPLSHHEILRWLAPFSARGLQIDLAATDRVARILVFRPCLHAAVPGVLPACREELRLDLAREDTPRLIRRLVPEQGPTASLELSGTAAEPLLEALARQPLTVQFCCGEDWLVAWQQTLEVTAATGQATTTPLLRAAEARVAGLTLRLQMSRVSSVPADVLLDLEPVTAWDLPDDLFTVLGWQWGAHPRRTPSGWTTTLLLRGRPEVRTARARTEFERAASHLAQTLREPPAAFHDRCAGARWRVAWRRSLPLTISIALMLGAVLLHRIPMGSASTLRMLVFNAPPILLVVAFSLRELPRLELPRWPRPSLRSSWRSA